MALSRCLASITLLAAADGARVARKRTDTAAQTKFIAGVPILEYHAAYGGNAALVDIQNTEQEWNVFVKSGSEVQDLCGMVPHGCNLAGHPTGGAPFVELRATEADLEKMIQGSGGMVTFIEPDQEESLIPDNMEDVDVEAATWGLNRIGADSRARTGSGATIYVQDTGVRVSHREFTGRAASALDVTSGRAVACNGDVNCAADRQGHGTHCAGSAAGQTFGVASTAQVRGVKTLSDRGSGARSWQYIAIDWVTVNGVRPAVLSMSLGGNGADPGYTTVIDAAVNAGVVVVVAAGNSNRDACSFSPAFAANAITVGSTTSTDQRSGFSNYGRCVQIWAPGSSVTSASHRSDTGSATFSGTSMACPHVAGAAALVLDADPSKKASAVLASLLGSAERDAISGLRSGDTNALLFVGEGRKSTRSGGCTSPDDREIIRQRFDTLVGDVRGCVISCVGQGDSCSVGCVERMGFSSGCARCVADLGNCAKSRCLFQCLNPSSASCQRCTVDRCYGDLVACTGLPESELPKP